MKKRKLTLIICIPSYEADESLALTLGNIYKQKDFRKTEGVLVAIDGNEIDKEILTKIKNNKLEIKYFKSRQGQASRINDLFKLSKSEYIFLTNDDVILEKNTISNILKETINKKLDLYACNVRPLKGKNFLQNIFNAGYEIAKSIALNWNGGDNYLLYNGRGLVLSKKLYKKIVIPNKLWNNDAFIYIYAKINKFKNGYIPTAKINYLQPRSLKEWLNQSLKFKNSKVENREYFKRDLDSFFKKPTAAILKSVTASFVKYPVYTTFYMSIFILVNFFLKVVQSDNFYWKTDKSTKLQLNKI